MYKKIMGLLIFFLVGFSNSAMTTGQDVGNGGDAILCVQSNDNHFFGHYSLDYLAQYNPEAEPLEVDSVDESLDRIQAMLISNLPEMVASFAYYRYNLFNEFDLTQDHIWESATNGLIDIEDEDLLINLPDNCVSENNNQAFQAVIQSEEFDETRFFQYDPKVLQNLEDTDPVQLSFLLIHEWLWQYCESARCVRRVNYWLHSSLLDDLSATEFRKALKRAGLVIYGDETDIFEDYYCASDIDAQRNFIEFTSSLDSEGEKLSETPGTLLAMSRECSLDGESCDDFEYNDRLTNKLYGLTLGLQISDSTLWRDIFDSNEDLLNCQLPDSEDEEVSCDVVSFFTNWNENSNELNIGRSCLKLEAYAQKKNRDKLIQYKAVLLYDGFENW